VREKKLYIYIYIYAVQNVLPSSGADSLRPPCADVQLLSGPTELVYARLFFLSGSVIRLNLSWIA
jgi:hypothetical protein